MKVDPALAAELGGEYYYLQQKGMSNLFTAKALDDNSGARYINEKGEINIDDLESLLYKLDISKNKLLILLMLKRGDIIPLLYLLGKDALLTAMNFFPRAKLLRFLSSLPKEMLIKMLLQVISIETILSFLPPNILFNILRNKQMDVRTLVQGFDVMPVASLRQLMTRITGQNVDKVKHRELMAMFMELKKSHILEAMKKWPRKHIFRFVAFQVKKNPKLLTMIPKGNMMRIMSSLTKPSLLQLFRLLPKNLLVQYVSQLPFKFLAMSASQMDDSVFAHVLLHKFPNLIMQLAGAAA